MRRLARTALALGVAAAGLVAGPAVAGPGPEAPNSQELTSVVPVLWQGQLWGARESGPLTQAPAPNRWLATPQTVWVDNDGSLHLATKNVGGVWFSAGVTSMKNDYGYGTYRYVVDTSLSSFDPMAVVGMFTYNKSASSGHQEIDVELSRWGQPSISAPNTQFVIQPWRLGDNLRRFPAPTDRSLTYEWTWAPSGVLFKVRDGVSPTAPVIRKWRAAATPVPSAGTQVHLNLWFYRGEPPYDRQNQQVVFRSFTYTPA